MKGRRRSLLSCCGVAALMVLSAPAASYARTGFAEGGFLSTRGSVETARLNTEPAVPGGNVSTASDTSVPEASSLIPPAGQDVAPPVARLNPSGRTQTIIAPIKDQQVFLGEVEVQIAPDDSIQVSVLQVFDLLSRTLSPDAVESLRPLAEPGVFAPLSWFGEHGLPLAFNPRALELTVDVPPAARSRQTIGLADLDRATYGEFASPEDFTAYLNLRTSTDYTHVGNSREGFSDPLVSLDGAARFGGVVLESEATWDTGERGFSRDGTRFVYDDIGRLNRWTLGDLQPQGRGFQGVQDMAGISVARTYNLLEPQRNVAPRGGRSFSLDRASTVEAFVNGRSVRTIRLEPGRYDVSDFPFVQGSNDVELVIVDDTGRREVVSFSLFIDRTQLAPGLSEYGFYSGVRTNRDSEGIDYSGDFTASGFYRYGLNENLTVGGSFQYADNASMVAGESVWGSPWGTVGADLALSRIEGAENGWATNVTFDRLISGENGSTSLVAGFEARSRRFGTGGQLTPDNPFMFNASMGMNRSFGDSSFAGAQVRYAKARNAFEDERSVRLTYGRRLSGNMNAIFDADWSSGGLAEGVNFRVALVRRFGDTGSIRAEYDTQGDRGRLGYQSSGGRGVGAWSASANLDAQSDAYGLNGAAAYAANRADLGIAHTTAYDQVQSEISDQRTSFRAASSIAFAGGRVAVGRPINDGFVIVQPYAGARDVMVEVEPSPEGYYARSGLLGPALYGQVTAYSPRTVIFDAPEAPPGFDVGQGAVRTLSPYRAGYLVTVGSEYGVTAIGRLLKLDGEPLALLAGVAIEQSGEGRRVDVFTNRAGAFGAGGLKQGRWRIEMPGDVPLVYDLIVPETPDGVARIGDLRPVQ